MTFQSCWSLFNQKRSMYTQLNWMRWLEVEKFAKGLWYIEMKDAAYGNNCQNLCERARMNWFVNLYIQYMGVYMYCVCMYVCMYVNSCITLLECLEWLQPNTYDLQSWTTIVEIRYPWLRVGRRWYVKIIQSNFNIIVRLLVFRVVEINHDTPDTIWVHP